MTNEHFVAQIVSMHLDPSPKGPATIQLEMPPGDWDLVLSTCDTGWMNDLEGEIIPILFSMFEDQTVTLNHDQQKILSVWVAKMALLLDSKTGRNMANRFYTKEEAVALRVNRELPPFTTICIGRLDVSGRAITGTRFNTTTDQAKLTGCATTRSPC